MAAPACKLRQEFGAGKERFFSSYRVRTLSTTRTEGGGHYCANYSRHSKRRPGARPRCSRCGTQQGTRDRGLGDGGVVRIDPEDALLTALRSVVRMTPVPSLCCVLAYTGTSYLVAVIFVIATSGTAGPALDRLDQPSLNLYERIVDFLRAAHVYHHQDR